MSPDTADYDFQVPGVACRGALREQGVECVGQDMDLFIRESAQQGRKWDLVLRSHESNTVAVPQAVTVLPLERRSSHYC